MEKKIILIIIIAIILAGCSALESTPVPLTPAEVKATETALAMELARKTELNNLQTQFAWFLYNGIMTAIVVIFCIVIFYVMWFAPVIRARWSVIDPQKIIFSDRFSFGSHAIHVPSKMTSSSARIGWDNMTYATGEKWVAPEDVRKSKVPDDEFTDRKSDDTFRMGERYE